MSEANQLSAMRPGSGQIRSKMTSDQMTHWRPHVTSWHPADNWSTQSNPGPEYFQISSIPCVGQQLVAIKIFCSPLIIFPSCPAVCINIKLLFNTY